MQRFIVYFILAVTAALYGQDRVEASFSPPGGLAVNNTPMFVCFGWDDNNFANGMNWVLDQIKDRKNPAGNGNPLTFDGRNVRSTFFMKGMVESVEPVEDVLASWKRAYDEGHEIGNHTFQHVAIDAVNEIRKCDSVLQMIGIPLNEVKGFRTPQLAIVPSVLDAVFNRPFLFDCTFEHHNSGTPNSTFVWPYTLEKGVHSSAYGAIATSYPGMWEMPVHQFPDGTTGFDYNAWTGGLSGSAYCSKLKSTLDGRLSSNHCPFFIGVHTDYYATTNTYFESIVSANCASRRQAITDFIDYALSKSDVRIVAYIDVINWMRNPVGLGQTPVSSSREKIKHVPVDISVDHSGVANLSVYSSGMYTVRLYNQIGQLVCETSVTYYAAGEHTIDLALKTISRGMYILAAYRNDGFVKRARFVKN